MKPLGAAVGILLCLPVCMGGCPYDSYQVTLTDLQTQLERSLEINYTSPIEAEHFSYKNEVDRIRKAYKNAEIQTQLLTASGKFTGEMPRDIGNHGTHTYIPTRLGSVSLYLERFRGAENIAANQARQQQALARLLEMVSQWLGKELPGNKDAAKLQQFLTGPLTQDAGNLMVLAWAMANRTRLLASAVEEAAPPPQGQPAPKKTALEEFGIPPSMNALTAEHAQAMVGMNAAALALQYLIERNYLKIEDVPALIRTNDDNRVTSILRRVLEKKSGVTDPQAVQALLGLISSEDRASDSFGAFLKTTPEYATLLKEWKDRKEKDPQEEEPDGREAIEKLGLNLPNLIPNFLGHDDVLRVTLDIRGELLYTNGVYDAAQRKIRWNWNIYDDEDKSPLLPILCTATWTLPDRNYQTRHFGRLALKDADLLTYALWYKGLSAKRAAEWDRLLDSLQPGPGLAKAAEEFKFSDHADKDPDAEEAVRFLDLIAGQETTTQPAK